MKHSLHITDYCLLIGIALIWGCQFIFTDIAVVSIPPLTLAAGRIFFGAVTLWILSLVVPSEQEKTSPSFLSLFKTYLFISFFEAILPFFLVAYGQQYVESGIAAILLGTIPLFTILLSYFFTPSSQRNIFTLLSVGIGFLGIITLINPFASSLSHTTFTGQLSLVTAAISFAFSLHLLKALPVNLPPLLAVRNILSIASIPMVFLSLLIDQPWTISWNITNFSCLFILGVFCAGIVYFMYMILIRKTDPTFASLTNYLIPPIGVFLGVLLRNESLYTHHFIALSIILIALLLTRYK